MKKSIELALACAFVVGVHRDANAEPTHCSETITRANVVSCAVAASLGARAERQGMESLESRKRTAEVILPSNPTLSLGGALPIEPGLTDRPVLWSAMLSQELEIAGQRGARVDVVSAEQKAQSLRVTLAGRGAAADALATYFDAVAAAEASALAERTVALASALKNVARARAQAGVGSDVDAQLADAAATRLADGQIAARQRLALAKATLASQLGLDPTEAKLRVEGSLSPLALVDAPVASLADAAVTRRAEVGVVEAEKEAQQLRATLYERLRIPNPTLSVYVRNDWIGERIAGVGIGFPIPLPASVGRTYAGDIAEAEALARRGQTEANALRRRVKLEVARASEVVAARKEQVALYGPERVRQTEQTLRAIADEIEARRLPIREALITQQGLIDYLYASLEARRALCLASVELARAAGHPLERGGP